MLIEAATEAGAMVIQPAMTSHPIETKGGWKIPVNITGKCTVTIFTKQLVIATGRRRFLKGQRKRLSHPMLAIYGYWRNNEMKGIESRIEAIEDGWIWGAPLPDGLFNAAVFSDPGLKPFSNRGQIQQYYLQRLTESKLLQQCIKGDLVEPLQACDASSYVMKETVGRNWICVGDAAIGIAPLSSQGVQTAIKTAILATAVIHTQLYKSNNHTTAIEFYNGRLTEIAHRHQSITEEFYNDQAVISDSEFWRKRMGSLAPISEKKPTPTQNKQQLNYTTRLRLAKSAKLIDQPVLIGNTIENRKALKHSYFDRPMAFVQNIELAPLIQYLKCDRTAEDLIFKWSQQIGFESASRILEWLFEAGVVNAIENLDRYTISPNNIGEG